MYLKNINLVSLLPYLLNSYLLLKIIFGNHGVFAIHTKSVEIKNSAMEYQRMKERNDINRIKASLISEDVINIRYLEELLRTQYSVVKSEEKVVILDYND